MKDQASSLRRIIKAGQNSLENINLNRKLRVVSVSSGKGGVGKTNVVAGLAISLARAGEKVLIIDADFGLANVDILFNIRPEFNIGDVISGEVGISDIIVELQENIYLIPAGSGISDLARLSEAQRLSLINEFDNIEIDINYVLVDTGAGISDNVLYFNLAADDCIVVTTPEPTAITDAYAFMKVMAGEHGYRYFKLIVNMVKSEKEAKKVYFSLSQAVSRFLGGGTIVEYLGFLPAEPGVSTSVIKRMPVMNIMPDSEYALCMMKAAKVLKNSLPRNLNSGNLKLFMNRFISSRESTN